MTARSVTILEAIAYVAQMEAQSNAKILHLEARYIRPLAESQVVRVTTNVRWTDSKGLRMTCNEWDVWFESTIDALYGEC